MAAPPTLRTPPLPPRASRLPRPGAALPGRAPELPRPSVKATVEDGRVHRPAGGALLTILVTFLAGLLLNADGVAHIADTQPFGWRRTAARAASRPFQAISHTLLLNRPRAWLADAVDAPTLLDAGRDPETSPATTVPQTRAPVTVPPRVPTAEDPLRVYLFGDSFLADVSRGLSAAVGKDERWDLTTDSRSGTGLTRPEIIDWPERIRDKLPEDADVVVLGFGGNDAQQIRADGGQAEVDEPEWEVEYQERIAEVLGVVARPGRTIIWIGMPAATPKNMEKARPAMTRAAKAELAKLPGSLFLDTAAELSGGDDRYKDLLTIDGEPKRVRAADGYHLSPTGALFMGRVLARLVATVWPVGGSGTDEEGSPTSSTSTSSTTSTTTSRSTSSTPSTSRPRFTAVP